MSGVLELRVFAFAGAKGLILNEVAVEVEFIMLTLFPTVVFASGAAAVDSTRLGLSKAAANSQ